MDKVDRKSIRTGKFSVDQDLAENTLDSSHWLTGELKKPRAIHLQAFVACMFVQGNSQQRTHEHGPF